MINSAAENSSDAGVFQNFVKNDTKPKYPFVPKTKDMPKDTYQKPQTSAEKSDLTRAVNWLNAPVDNPAYTNYALRGLNIPPKISRFRQIMQTVLNIAVVSFCGFYMYKVMGGMGFSKSKAAVKNVWQNIDGAQKLEELALPAALKETAENIVYKIQNAEQFQAKGGKYSNAALLYGPPGTGKTTFAKAIAKAFPDSRFASIDLGSMESKWVGETERQLNGAAAEVCRWAEQNPDKRVFVLLDEIDSFAIADNGSHNQQYAQSKLNVLKKIIAEKFFAFKNITVIGTTNIELNASENGSRFVQKLDSAIVDRFSEKIRVDNPTIEQFQKAIAQHYSGLAGVPDCLKNEGSEEVRKIAEKLASENASFRTLESIYSKAACADKKSKTLTFNDVWKAVTSSITEGKTQNGIGFRTV